MNNPERKELIEGKFLELYGRDPELWVRAPGRVDLMGSHTDYNMGYVMTMPISRDLWIAAAPADAKERKESHIRLYSLNLKESAEIDTGELHKKSGWADYPAGVASVLLDAGYGVQGFDAVIHSTIPMESGLSSSAALESAVIVLFQRLGNYAIPSLESAKLCQQAENNFVGMNCGILDQYSSILGEADKSILLDCRSLTHEAVPFPGDLTAVICNTRAPRQLTGSEYGDRRAQCEEAAAAAARRFEGVRALRDVELSQLEACRQDMSEEAYKRGKFIIEENSRSVDLAQAFRRQDFAAIQNLYTRSFTGARDLFEISIPAMEQMMEAMTGAPGIAGARQAGAGFGGCMIALVKKTDTEAFGKSVEEHYFRLSGLNCEVYPVTADKGAGIIGF